MPEVMVATRACPSCQRLVRLGDLRLYDYRDGWTCVHCTPDSPHLPHYWFVNP